MLKRLFVFLVVLAVVASAAAWWMSRRIQTPYRGFTDAEVFVSVPIGTGVSGIASRLETAGVVPDDGLRTGVTVAMSWNVDRALLTWPGAIAELAADDVSDAALAGAQHLHVSSYYLQTKLRPQLGELFARARAAGLTTSLDPGSDPEQRWGRELIEVLRHVDVFLPNQSEASAITGTDTPEDALRALDNGSTRLVVKAGSRGALMLDHGKSLSAAGYSTQAVDTTGEFADKSTIVGAPGLLGYLEKQDTQVRTTFSKKLIGYALGRTILASDRPLINEMVAAGPGASFADLAVKIVTSRQFRNRTGETGAAANAKAAAPAQIARVTPSTTSAGAR